MASMDSYSKTAVERAMKVQEAILRAMAKRITWWQAAEIIGISDRHMRRWRERYEEFGYDGLLDRRLGRPSPRRVPMARAEKVLALYRERYFDLNGNHFHEKLQQEHHIEISYTWVKLALQGAGLVSRGRKRGVHRKRRPRRPLPGMLLHIDGSHHRWFQDERWYDLMVILDDATNEIYYAQLVEEKSTLTVMAGLREVIAGKGLAGCNVVVHQHLDGTISLTHGPHLLGRYTAQGVSVATTQTPARRVVEKTLRGKVQKQTFPPRLEIPQTPRDSHFPTTSTAAGLTRTGHLMCYENRTF